MSPFDVAISRQGDVTPGAGVHRAEGRRLVAVALMPGRVQVALDSRRLGLLSRPPNSRRTPGTSRLPLPGLRPRAVNPVRTASWRLARPGAGATLEEQGRRRAWARCEDCIGRDVIPMGSEGHEESERVARAPVIGVPRGPATAAVRGCRWPWLLGRRAYFTAGPTLSKIVETSLDALTILISVLAPSRGRARRGPSNRAGPRPQSVHPRGPPSRPRTWLPPRQGRHWSPLPRASRVCRSLVGSPSRDAVGCR